MTSKESNKSQKRINPFAEMEKEVLNFWEKAKTFEKSIEKEAPQGDYVFYDGPPFATGLPHYGHIVASIIKDVVPRYQTMRGYRVERKWGWDCHGLPIENIVEKELGSQSKKDIEKMGVVKFNELCRSKVLSYVDEWKKVIRKLGRWADMENSYKTMDIEFMESVWWVFKELWDKDLIYKDYRSMHICPRCETTLSQSEVTEGYKTIKDLSAITKFELVNEPGTFILAWTTTPWTLPGNVALAVGKDVKYLTATFIDFETNRKEKYIFANFFIEKIISLGYIKVDDIDNKKLVDEARKRTNKGVYEMGEEINAEDLIGKQYKPLFNYLNVIVDDGKTPRVLKKQNSNNGIEPQFARKIENYNNEEWEKLNKEIQKSSDEVRKFKENSYKIYMADFDITKDGTGVVHIAPAFGEDDMTLGQKNDLPFIQHVKMDGTFEEDILYQEDDEFIDNFTDKKNPWVGINVKPIENAMSTDIEIIKYLAHNNLLFHKEKYEHSYPHCWRCDTPLINYATSSWFVNIIKIKKDIFKNAKSINWSPEHIKEGRFGNWLEGARDWSISRQRFWASVIPIWECECGERVVIGSVKELEDLSGKKVNDLHKHIVDKITFPCKKCKGEMKRVSDVLDTWFDSGSMPYAQMHYPFENKEKFDNNFPAEFIAEGADQTRAWFYYLHSIASGIKKKPAFKNAIVNGIVLAEDGKKMSKKLQNYPDPMEVFDNYGADALRYYLLTSPVMLADTLCFSEKGVQESLRKVNMLLWNVTKFYNMFVDTSPQSSPRTVEGETSVPKSDHILDKWILARLNQLIQESTEAMDKYNLPKASRPIMNFVDDLSTWYIRRSRDRFKSDDEKDKQIALEVTNYVLLQLSKVIAPFIPFIAEQVWQSVTGNNFQDENKSVHLESWPSSFEVLTNDIRLLEEMKGTRNAIRLGLSARDLASIKVRQPLEILYLDLGNFNHNNKDLVELIKLEVNVKKVELMTDASLRDFKKRERGIRKVLKGKYKGKYAIDRDNSGTVALKLDINPELKLEGIKRELVRSINALRKKSGLTIQDIVKISWQSDDKDIKKTIKKYKADLMNDTLSSELAEQKNIDSDDIKINDNNIKLHIEN